MAGGVALLNDARISHARPTDKTPRNGIVCNYE